MSLSGGLTLAWIIPEGSLVEEGQPVIRFDNTQARLNLEKQQSDLKANACERKILLREQKTESTTLGIDIAGAVEDYDYAMNVLPQDETIFSKWDIIEAQLNAALAKKRIGVLEDKQDLQKKIARSDRRILSIERDRAKAEVEIAQQALDALELAAPVSGLVLYHRDRGRAPQIGDVCWRGQLLLELVDPTRNQDEISDCEIWRLLLHRGFHLQSPNHSLNRHQAGQRLGAELPLPFGFRPRSRL